MSGSTPDPTSLSLILHAGLAVALLIAFVVLMVVYQTNPFLPTLSTGFLALISMAVGYFFGHAS